MMKICIVTWNKSRNYGTCLQSYALYRYIEKMGYEPYILTKFHAPYKAVCVGHFVRSKVKALWGRMVHTKKNSAFANQPADAQWGKIIRFSRRFNEMAIRNRRDWNYIRKDILAFISGGDQIWNPNYLSRSSLLDFLYGQKDIIKLSYGTSIGVMDIPNQLHSLYRTFWKEYDAIGVREKRAAELIKEISGCHAEVVVDPVFLLSDREWTAFSTHSGQLYDLPKDYMFCYFVDANERYFECAGAMKAETGYPIVMISLEAEGAGDYVIEDAGPEDYITLLRNASVILTDSYHAIALSLIFNREFYVIRRFSDADIHSENSRVYEILKEYGLEWRMIEKSNIGFHKCIDYTSVNVKIRNNVANSKNYLEKNLIRKE